MLIHEKEFKRENGDTYLITVGAYEMNNKLCHGIMRVALRKKGRGQKYKIMCAGFDKINDEEYKENIATCLVHVTKSEINQTFLALHERTRPPLFRRLVGVEEVSGMGIYEDE